MGANAFTLMFSFGFSSIGNFESLSFGCSTGIAGYSMLCILNLICHFQKPKLSICTLSKIQTLKQPKKHRYELRYNTTRRFSNFKKIRTRTHWEYTLSYLPFFLSLVKKTGFPFILLTYNCFSFKFGSNIKDSSIFALKHFLNSVQ